MVATPDPPKRNRLRQVLAVLGYAAILVLALRTIDPKGFFEVLRAVRVQHVAAVLAFIALHLGTRSYRYHALVARSRPEGGYRMSDGFRIFLLGLAASAVTPARAGDLIKVELVRPYGLKRSTGLGLVVIERILDLLAVNATIVCVGFFLAKDLQRDDLSWAAVAFLAALAAGTAVISWRRPRKWMIHVVTQVITRVRKELAGRVDIAAQRLFEAWDDIFTSPGVALRYFLLSVGAWLFDFLKLWILLQAVGGDVSVLAVLFVYPLSLMAGILTLLPFSDGVVGVTAVALLSSLTHVDVEMAAATVAVDRALSTLAPFLLYWVFALLKKKDAGSAEAP
ncbi:MAG TPA: lysylphosphatidylglycerol synthase transmembrane domain-containing protein [Polyangiales bacterium]